jgi:hypothetical protein
VEVAERVVNATESRKMEWVSNSQTYDHAFGPFLIFWGGSYHSHMFQMVLDSQSAVRSA